MKKVLVLGKNSFVASHLPYEKCPEHFSSYEWQLRGRMLLEHLAPDVVINCIGFTGGKNIDGCETDKERTLEANLLVPTVVAMECQRLGIKFLHIGSGCVNYGQSPNIIGIGCVLGATNDLGWLETDSPRLENASFYSKIKYACNLAIKDLPNTCILQIRMPISTKNHPRNLINKLRGYESVLEAPNSVTFMDDLVRAIDWVIENDKRGIYNVTNPDPLTHIEILEEYRKYFPEHQYKRINEQELGQFVKAPRSNCILNTHRLQGEGFNMTPTKKALTECMKSYVEGLAK